MNLRLACLLVAFAASLALVSPQDDSGFATRGYPQDMVAAAKLAERRCTKCHTLGRVLEGEYVGVEWTPIVQQMAKKEKSGISAQEATTISQFLAYRSTHKPGSDKASDSRPAAGSASRPTTFGGTAAYPVPANTIYASAPLAPSATLPATLDLGGVAVVVREASAASKEGKTSRASVRIVVGEKETDLVLGREEGGAYSTELFTLRTWTIGPHSFRLVMALYEADLSYSEGRPAITLATLVVRAAK